MTLSGLLKPTFLFSLITCLLMYLGKEEEGGMSRGGRGRRAGCSVFQGPTDDLI